MPTCPCDGCSARAAQFSPFCIKHTARKLRQGHPEQRAVSKSDVRPYVEAVHDRIARDPANPAWGLADGCWTALTGHVTGTLMERFSGRPHSRFKIEAASLIVRIAETVRPRDVVAIVVGLYLMRAADPDAFRDEAAFRNQLVRRVRGLAQMNEGGRWSRHESRIVRRYRDMAAATTAQMAEWIVQHFGTLGERLAAVQTAERGAKLAAEAEFKAALKAIA